MVMLAVQNGKMNPLSSLNSKIDVISQDESDSLKTLKQVVSALKSQTDYYGVRSFSVTPGLAFTPQVVQETLGQKAMHELDHQGYTLLHHALSTNELESIKHQIQTLKMSEAGHSNSEHHYSEQRVFRLANLAVKDESFLSLALNKVVLCGAQSCFKRGGIKLQYMNYREPQPWAERQHWHIDSNALLNYDTQYPENYTAIWYLEDSKPEEGATVILPKSHQLDFSPDNGKYRQPLQHEVSLEARAGDLLLFNGNLWHCGGENPSFNTPGRILVHYKSDSVLWDQGDGLLEQVDYPGKCADAEKLLVFKKSIDQT